MVCHLSVQRLESMTMLDALATVVITTKNRKEELRNAIASALAQDVPVEVLVIDDGSTDGTAEMVRASFPEVRLERSEESLGYIVQRGRGAELAAAPILVSIDDDAIFPSRATVRQTLADFDHPRIAAVAMPYVDVKYSDQIHQKAPDDLGIWIISEYRGTAHALRRQVFRCLGGYRAPFVHQVEEGEYCMRMLNAGYVVRLGRADPVHHLESPKRDRSRIYRFQTRNHILWAWYDVPNVFLPIHLAATTFKTLWIGFRNGYWKASAEGAIQGYRQIRKHFAARSAVSLAAYRLFRILRRLGPIRLQDVERRLRSIPASGAAPSDHNKHQ
jgi:glycosyltransferase involved in cell wall biosynthesis